MDLGISGRRALVTGAGRGIGNAIAKCLAREGVVVAVVSRTARDLERLVDELDGFANGHRAIPMDLMAEGAPAKLMCNIEDFGPLDIVVHNVGGTLAITDPFCGLSDWRAVYRFNFEIAIELNGMILPAMQKRKWGRVVHISSTHV
jgi:3-oxoacyl-[acyl-carrier protein] reductase